MTLPQLHRQQCVVDGHVLHLRPALAELLSLLLAGSPTGYMHIDTIVEAMWPDPDLQPETAEDAVRVYMSHLRRLGVTIETRFPAGRCVRWLNGWRIPVEARGGRAAPLARRLVA